MLGKLTLLGRLIIGLSTTLAMQAAAVDLDGRLDWGARVELSPLVSGVVAEVAADAGQRVSKRQLLLRLDQGALQAAVREAEAQEAYLGKMRAEAERERERAQELYDRTLLSDHDLELALIAFARAEADYQAASARLAEARLKLEYSAIRAPFDGVVIAVNAVPGQTVITRLQSVPLVALGSTERMQVQVAVAEDALAELSPGQAVAVRTGTSRFDGRIDSIGYEPVAGEPVRYPVIVSFEPGDAVLRPGQRAVVTLP